MKRISLLIIILISVNQLFSQQDPQFSMNMYNHLAINPGYAGSNDAICVTGLNRNQWMGFEGRPVTTVVGAHMSLPDFNSGVGLNIMQDNLAFNKDFHMNLAYAYRLELGDGILGLGLGLGFIQKAFDGQDLKSPSSLLNPNENVYADPAIPHSDSKIVFDSNFGAFYRTNDLYVGISTTHLTQPQIKLDEGKNPFVRRHYYVAAGYYWQLPDPQWEFRPSVFMKIDGATAMYDLNATLQYNKQFWGGVTYRMGDAFIAMIGYNTLMDLGFGLSYDFTTSALRSHQSGSLEIMVRYCFNIEKSNNRSTYRSVRFL